MPATHKTTGVLGARTGRRLSRSVKSPYGERSRRTRPSQCSPAVRHWDLHPPFRALTHGAPSSSYTTPGHALVVSGWIGCPASSEATHGRPTVDGYPGAPDPTSLTAMPDGSSGMVAISPPAAYIAPMRPHLVIWVLVGVVVLPKLWTSLISSSPRLRHCSSLARNSGSSSGPGYRS